MVNISPSVGQIRQCTDGTALEYMECKERNCSNRYWTSKPIGDPSRNYCLAHQSLAKPQERRSLFSRFFRKNKTEAPKVYQISNRPCDRCGGLITWDVRIDGNKPTHVDEDGHIQGDGKCPRYSTTSQQAQSNSQKKKRPKFGVNKDKLIKHRWYILGFAGIITVIELVIIFGAYPIDGPYLDLYAAMFFQAIFKYIVGILGLIVGLTTLFFAILKIITEKEKDDKKKYRKYLALAIFLILIGLYFATTPTNSFNIEPEFVSFYYTKISYFP